MTAWNEDNFLEKLLALARQASSAEREPCPDAEVLCAVLEGEAPAPLRQLVLEHVRHCPDCAFLQSRLLNFAAGASPEPEAVWGETQKRLDNWLEGFLRSKTAGFRAPQPTSVPHTSPRWESLWSFFNSRKLVWGLGMVAFAALIGDAILVLELRRGQPGHAQMAAQSAAPQSQAANLQPSTPAPSAVEPSRGGEIEAGRASEGVKSHPEGTTEESQKPLQGQAVPQVGEHPAAAAPYEAARTNPPPRAGRPRSIPQLPNPHNPTVAQSAPPSLVIPEDRQPSTLNAQATPPPPNPASTPLPGPRATPGETAPHRSLNSAFSMSLARATGRPAIATTSPTSLQFDPSAHLMVALSSAKRLPNGSFEFRGSLLLPVSQAGAAPLDLGTEVVGAGETREGTTSLAVMEFVVNGARYILKEGSGAMKAQTPGTGGAVQFERSQVLEMWPISPLVYARAATPLTNDDVVRMLQAKVSDAVVVAKIRSSPCQFDTSTDTVLKLKQAGASDTVLRAMAEAGRPPQVAAPAAAQPEPMISAAYTPAPKATSTPPPSLQLDPSAHLLVAVSSARQLPNGSFQFHGTLLLPVARTGPVALVSGAEVVGAGQTRNGQTTLAVMEFIVQGRRYILKDGSGAMKAQTPGTGGAVEFDRSQVLEMWPMSPWTYEKAPDTPAPPKSQK
jgi:hypothetical protein